ncbi:MAG: 1-deoxy-D-xylulose-5-phosphate reductoisomerase, partial [Pseudomonadota bacterium]|nr:1-deoxy-D-xylulose-5-phosphate reductoisomerase [Pseudomonadota bacterium]
MTQRVAVLGSTGSVGANTLDVIARHPERFEAFALSASTQVDVMLEQVAKFRPRHAVMADEAAGCELRRQVQANGLEAQVDWGQA